jgi:hypothetical protein
LSLQSVPTVFAGGLSRKQFSNTPRRSGIEAIRLPFFSAFCHSASNASLAFSRERAALSRSLPLLLVE